MSKSIQWLCVMFVLVLPSIIPAQEWVARYNGSVNGDDGAYAIAVDNTGNIYVTGWSVGPGTNYDYATVKYNASGIEQWVVRYNGPDSEEDYAYAIAVDNSSNAYVTGQSYDSGTNYDYATVKYNASGIEQWAARCNGPDSGWDRAYAIAVDNSGNVYVTGQSWGTGTNHDYATVKYNSSGIEQWVARYNGPSSGYDGAYAIAVDNSGNVYVTGQSVGSDTNYDYATVKYNASGIEQWVARYNGPDNGDDWANAIAIDNSGNAYVTGQSWGSGTGDDYATVKYDSSGIEQWVVRYNGPDNGDDWANAIAIDNSGNAYVTGQSWGSGTGDDYATVKYDSSGIEQWVVQYNGLGNQNDWARAIAVDNSGNAYVTGQSWGSGTGDDYATVKYDSSGIEQWVARYNGPGNEGDRANAITVDIVGYVYVVGASWGSGTDFDYATIKYSPTGIEEQRIITVGDNYLGATILRGPLQLPAGKKCKVYDITGRVVTSDKIQPGIYFIEIDDVVTQKVVKIR